MLEEVVPKKRSILMTFNFDREEEGSGRSIKKIAMVELAYPARVHCL
jgi:hypothetical protein